MNEEQKKKFDKEMSNLVENLDKTFLRMMTVWSQNCRIKFEID